MRVGLISLGCSKNLVDSEMILGLFAESDFQIVQNIQQADLIIINTCGFIQSAKEEAITTIFSTLKDKRPSADVFVVGCLAQRYYDVLRQDLPEVAQFVRIQDYSKIGAIINEHYGKKLLKSEGLSFQQRVFATQPHVGYVRIADGCDNRCTYCAIPLIRGNYHSRSMEDIVAEVAMQIERGHYEINLISQDTSHYGHDIALTLLDLLKRLVKLEGLGLIRLLYLYPAHIQEDLLLFMQQHPQIAPYFDIPIQHGSDRILKKMGRKDTAEKIINLANMIRSYLPKAILRTTVIVGFPDEQQEDFEQLISLVKQVEFDRLGAFMYSPEEDTPAATFYPQIPNKTKEERYHRLMQTQQKIALTQSKRRIGEVTKVFIEGYDKQLKRYKARDYSFAPDQIDGYIYVQTNKILHPGHQMNVKIIDTYFYDLLAIELSD